MKEFRNKEVEDAQDGTTGNDGTLDDKNKKFSLRKHWIKYINNQ
jgi:hypothetical protein